jgi:hypothetical protein
MDNDVHDGGDDEDDEQAGEDGAMERRWRILHFSHGSSCLAMPRPHSPAQVVIGG